MCRSSFKGAQPLCQLFSKAPPLAGMVSASHTLDKLRQKDLMNCVLFLCRTDLFYFNVELFYSEYFLILTIVPPCICCKRSIYIDCEYVCFHAML